MTTASNLGAGEGVFAGKVIEDLQFKSLIAGTNVTLVSTATDITISSIDTTSVEDGANVGSGTGLIFRDKIGLILNFKSLLQSTLITITNNADDISIATTAEINTASNVGGGVGVFKQKTISDLEFKSLLANTEVLIASNVDDLAFSIGAIAISKITNLQTELDSKIDTVVNVGAGTGLVFRDKIAQTANLKSLIGGTGIAVTDNADDITFDVSSGAARSFLVNSFSSVSPNSTNFLAIVGELSATATESDRQVAFANAAVIQRLTINVAVNPSATTTDFKLRVNGVDGNLVVVIPIGLTGVFQDLVNSDTIANGDLLNYQVVFAGAKLDYQSSCIEVLI